MPIEKCVLPLGQPSGNNITHTERSWCQGQLSCKDVGDGRHVLIFHFVGVSEHVAAGRGCSEADRRREAAPPARHPPAAELPDTSRTINGRRCRRTAPTCARLCTSGSPDGDDPSGGGGGGKLADGGKLGASPATALGQQKRPMEIALGEPPWKLQGALSRAWRGSKRLSNNGSGRRYGVTDAWRRWSQPEMSLPPELIDLGEPCCSVCRFGRRVWSGSAFVR